MESTPRTKITEWLWILFTIVTCIAIPAIVLISVATVYQNTDDEEGISNQTACSYTKQFTLSGNVFATICEIGGTVVLDIRRFINGTASITGIGLNLQQWNVLKKIMLPEL